MKVNPYIYLLYKIYYFLRTYLSSEFKRIVPEAASAGIVSLLIIINIITLLNYIKFLPDLYVIILVFILLGIINYRLFIRNENYEKIYEKYRKESGWRKHTGTFLVILYIILTIYLFYYSVGIKIYHIFKYL